MAYASIEPFGEKRADLRAGIIASAIVNCMRSKGTDPVSPDDFMPIFDEELATQHRVEKQKRQTKKLRETFGK